MTSAPFPSPPADQPTERPQLRRSGTEKMLGGVCGGPAINFFFPYANTKASDVLRLAAGSGVLAMTAADYAHPEVGPLMDKWLVGPGIDSVVTRHFATPRGGSFAGRLAARFIEPRIDLQIAVSKFVADATSSPCVVLHNGVQSSGHT